MENRECRDILFCLLFTASVLAMAAIAIYGFSKGAPNRLLYPYDPDGKACGLDFTDRPYIMFPVPSLQCISKSVCVSKCP